MCHILNTPLSLSEQFCCSLQEITVRCTSTRRHAFLGEYESSTHIDESGSHLVDEWFTSLRISTDTKRVVLSSTPQKKEKKKTERTEQQDTPSKKHGGCVWGFQMAWKPARVGSRQAAAPATASSELRAPSSAGLHHGVRTLRPRGGAERPGPGPGAPIDRPDSPKNRPDSARPTESRDRRRRFFMVWAQHPLNEWLTQLG